VTTTTTPLGRSVSVDDWKAFQGDVVLKMLYDYQRALPSTTEVSLRIEQVVNGSAMGQQEATDVCVNLASMLLVLFDGRTVSLTASGRRAAHMYLHGSVFQSELKAESETTLDDVVQRLDRLIELFQEWRNER
jgi:hypothetical protein